MSMSILPQLIINSIIAGATYTLITLGFNLAYGTTKFLNTAHGSLAAIAGYTVFFLGRAFGLSLIPSAMLGIIGASAFGVLIERFVFRPLRHRRASAAVLFLASLGVFTMIQAALAIGFTSQFQQLGDVGAPRYDIFGAVITAPQVIIILACIVVFSALLLILNKTMFGKAVKAVADDEEVARIMGIQTDSVIARVFAISSGIAGLAGILIGVDIGIQPTMGLWIFLEGAISAVVGGIGNIYGGVLGSFLLGFAENFGIWKISSAWKPAIAFGILIVFLVFRPKGIIKQ